jgi:putative resolvase
VCYARVSSHDQAEQLKTQAARFEKLCRDAGFTDAEVVNELGTSLNYHKKGLQRLLQDVLDGRVVRLVLVTKGWLLRFGSELLFGICEFFHVEVVVLDAAPSVIREQLSAANYLRHRAACSGVPSCHPAASGSVPDESPLGSCHKKLCCPS